MKYKDHKDHGWRKSWNMGGNYSFNYCAKKSCGCAEACCRRERPRKTRNG